VRRLAVADQPRDVAHGDRRLIGQQLRGGAHASRQQILVKAQLAELRVGSLHLARRAADRARDDRKRQRAAVVARDDHAREQIQPPSGKERLRLHIPDYDRTGRRGTPVGSGRVGSGRVGVQEYWRATRSASAR
jgi:hypothetical protein